MNNISPELHGLPKRLVDNNLIDASQLKAASRSAKTANISLVQHLCDQSLISDKALGNCIAAEFGMPIYALEHHNIGNIPKGLIDNKLLERHLIMPLFQRGNTVFVAIADPTDYRAIDEIQFQLGNRVEPILAYYCSIKAALERWLDNSRYRNIGEVLSTIDNMHLNNLDADAVEDQQDISDSDDEDETPIVRFINKMLTDAIKIGASDIHFEPYEKSYRVRFRVDGILREIAKPPIRVARRLATRLKVISMMDISERRIPQDGRVKLKLSEKKSVDFRVNTLPLQFGEKIVMRVLDSTKATLDIDTLGFENSQKALYSKALTRPQGMILVTGPTGSGKTVSLYTGLNILNTAERNINTAEDPIEINLTGINQTQINTRVGLGFSEALRSFLRQDPDVVMVGEIRDLETAEIAIKAAQTGHLVMSTLHTNSAPETLTRLLNMGVPSFNVATSVSLIIAQRLSRKLCTHCRIPCENVPDNVLAQEGFDDIGIAKDKFSFFKPSSCDNCTNGYRGRVGVYEILQVTPTISDIIMQGGSSLDILQAALKEGFIPLRVSALRKVSRGVMSIEEANRVTKD
ncbi:MAG: type IV-A pilus assembly ATPase PilB [Porticoccaceae bacterium]